MILASLCYPHNFDHGFNCTSLMPFQQEGLDTIPDIHLSRSFRWRALFDILPYIRVELPNAGSIFKKFFGSDGYSTKLKCFFSSCNYAYTDLSSSMEDTVGYLPWNNDQVFDISLLILNMREVLDAENMFKWRQSEKPCLKVITTTQIQWEQTMRFVSPVTGQTVACNSD